MMCLYEITNQILRVKVKNRVCKINGAFFHQPGSIFSGQTQPGYFMKPDNLHVNNNLLSDPTVLKVISVSCE